MNCRHLVVALALLINCTYAAVANDDFSEELVISRLPTGNVLTQFRFVITSGSMMLGPEYTLFPRIIADMISSHSLSQLTLSLGQGRWWADQWGLPPQPSAPTGAHVHAIIKGDNDTRVDASWKTLVNALNGVFCTSLTSIVPSLTSIPLLTMLPSKSVYGSSPLHSRYAALSKESLCTENLTPWKKLLPCKQNGLVTLLNPIKLYSSIYHTMGLTLSPVCKDNGCLYRLELNLVMVSDIDLRTRKLDWDLESIFGRQVSGACSAASSSKILVARDTSDQTLDPKPMRIQNGVAIYDITQDNAVPTLSLASYHKDLLDVSEQKSAGVISLTSVLGGSDQHKGVMISRISNHGVSRKVVFTHLLPWFVQMYYHSLTIECRSIGSADVQLVLFERKIFTPAISRERPSLIEWQFVLPSTSTCEISFDFDKAFLRLREYPPDANHGLYVPAASLTILETAGLKTVSIGGPTWTGADELSFSDENRTSSQLVLHSNVLLMALPTPDFSMPFNVICFVLTAISLCFGPIHNFSTKMLIPMNSKLPMAPKFKKILRIVLMVLLVGACYAQYHEIGMNEMRRAIVSGVEFVKESFEKMNSL